MAITRTFIRSVSTKRAKQNRSYSKLRKEYLVAHPYCAVFPKLRAVDIHHTNGRNGVRLTMVEWWKGVSRKGHRYIHDHPAWAREHGFFINVPLPNVFLPVEDEGVVPATPVEQQPVGNSQAGVLDLA